MLRLTADDFRKASDKIFLEFMKNRDYTSKKYPLDTVTCLNNAKVFISLLIPKSEWTADDYLRVMQCNQFKAEILIDMCVRMVAPCKVVLSPQYKEEIKAEDFVVTATYLENLESCMRDIRELYAENTKPELTSIAFHMSAHIALLKYQYKKMKGAFSFSDTIASQAEMDASQQLIEKIILITTKTKTWSIEESKTLTELTVVAIEGYLLCQLPVNALIMYMMLLDVNVRVNTTDQHDQYYQISTLSHIYQFANQIGQALKEEHFTDTVVIWSRFFSTGPDLSWQHIQEVWKNLNNEAKPAPHSRRLLSHILKLVDNYRLERRFCQLPISRALKDPTIAAEFHAMIIKPEPVVTRRLSGQRLFDGVELPVENQGRVEPKYGASISQKY